MKKTFPGGIHPAYNKEMTANSAIRSLPIFSQFVVPMQQHIGAPAEPEVKKGDVVIIGQRIGSSNKPLSAAVHAPVSGRVRGVEPRLQPNGANVLSVVIDADQDLATEKWELLETHPEPKQLSGEQVRAQIAAAGIVGLGGAGFPTAVKLQPPKKNEIDYLIINGSECEPYLTADDRLLYEHAADVILGAELMAKACDAKAIVVAVEDNKQEALRLLRKNYSHLKHVHIVELETKYPQGGEKQLIQAVCGREVPSGGLPFQAGVIVQNVGTARAVVQAVKHGKPLVERVVTVAGSGVRDPGNFHVRLGTSVRDVLEAAGGLQPDCAKIVIGGPMMGLAIGDIDVPVIKTTSGILALSERECQATEPAACIRCARCVDACPAKLMPLRIELYAIKAMWDRAEEYGALDCIECGCCNYVCPSKRHLVHWIRLAKSQIIANRQKTRE